MKPPLPQKAVAELAKRAVRSFVPSMTPSRSTQATVGERATFPEPAERGFINAAGLFWEPGRFPYSRRPRSMRRECHKAFADVLRNIAAIFGRRILLTALTIAGTIVTATAQVDLSKDLLSGKLFPPDLVLRQADQIGLTPNQRDAVMKLVREMKTTMGAAHDRLRDATEKLAPSLQSPSVDEQQAFAQFGDMLKIEQEIKQGQFAMLVRVKNLLSPEQQEKLREIVLKQPVKGSVRTKKETTDGATTSNVREELNARMQKVQAGVERWRREGRDPAPILELMKEFGEQMQAGKLSEAKQTLNQALQRLNEEKR